MRGIQKKVEATIFIPQVNFDYAQRTPFRTFSVQNWYVSYFMFHGFGFPDSFTVRAGYSSLFRTCFFVSLNLLFK